MKRFMKKLLVLLLAGVILTGNFGLPPGMEVKAAGKEQLNKYNHPMYMEIIGKEIKADGSNTGVSMNYNVPAKSTIYRYYKLSTPTSTFLFEKRTFSYSNNGGVGRLPLQQLTDLIFPMDFPVPVNFRWIT